MLCHHSWGTLLTLLALLNEEIRGGMGTYRVHPVR